MRRGLNNQHGGKRNAVCRGSRRHDDNCSGMVLFVSEEVNM